MKILFMIILLVTLSACATQTVVLPTETPVPTVVSATRVPTTTLLPLTITPSPEPTIIPLITPDSVQVERWKEYEEALAMKLLPPNSLRGKVLCEWEFLGRSDQEIYVWALCQSPSYVEELRPSVSSIPAVVYLGNDGAVQGVEIPGSGTAYARDIRAMFPPDVQEIIFRHPVDTEKMEAH